ncbi:MAG: hypothetical protein A2808_02205 [Candidatus Moranbacteria bacterium RIFCSPHIGHO2_01_FULL_55_24]|nr:MAG: hypothetical protein A2808_02205 [Candidatus Moranbacteria bacterium RIFCSPHIGHO2_01_FULL_55_24]
MPIFGKKKNEETEEGSALGKLLIGVVTTFFFGRISSFFAELLETAKDVTDEYIRRLVRSLTLAIAALTGVVFLLIGVAQYLSSLYRQPGSGEMIVGVTLLLISLVWFSIPGRK